jgi:putative heme-binding domain-containing protein
LKGVEEVFGDSDVYEAYPPADAKILLRGQVLMGMLPDSLPAEYLKKRASDRQQQWVNEPMMPVAWTRDYKNETGKSNKIFCTTLGAATDLQSEGLRRLIVNAVFWGLGLEIPSKANVDYIDPFKPSAFGFGAFRRGLRPADHALGVVLPQAGQILPRSNPVAEKKSSTILELKKNERIALVGNSLAERMNLYGHFETYLHTRFPKLELVVRNFARPADEVSIQQRPNDYTKLDDPLLVFKPQTFFCFYGFNESFAGVSGVEKFKKDYLTYLEGLVKQFGTEIKLVLVSPMAQETSPDPLFAEPNKANERLALYTEAVRQIAKEQDLPFVDVFTPTLKIFEKSRGFQFTTLGFQINEAGDREVAKIIDETLFEGSHPTKLSKQEFEKIRTAVIDKSWVHVQDYRMLNGWYVYGGRRTYDTETFPKEYQKIRNMVNVRDRYVWDMAQEKKVAPKPDDSQTGELHVPPTLFGQRDYSEPKELKYLSPEESIQAMKIPEGLEVQLVGSEREHPQLAKPVQLGFDNKGRLWVSTMPTYPQWKPGDPKPNDKLVILDDFQPDGRAGKMKVFYDKLQCPTGFEFWNGGVIVVDQPRLLFLKDTDGDDHADHVEVLSDGWATEDTHHTINAFEWSHGGLLHMLEGLSMSTAVETPWGPMRNKNTPGSYVMDPRNLRIRHFVTPGYGNPWCYVFNSWGQGIVGDGTSAQQHWDTPLSGAQFSGRRGLNPIFNNEGMRPVIGSEFILSRHFPEEMQGHFLYACVINMNGLTRFEIRDDGAGYGGNRLKKMVNEGGTSKQVPDDLLVSSDKNFRPIDPIIGPDGALYFGDWCNALIGHMQYSQRDPNRDKMRGRIFRLVNKNKALLRPITQYRKSVPDLLDQLKTYEPRTRYRARIELRDRPKAEVVVAVKNWVAELNQKNTTHDLHLCEALWVLQSHHAVNRDLLVKVLKAPTGEARAAAVRVLADEWDWISDPYELLKPMVRDEFPRVRVETLRALSFLKTPDSIKTALEAAELPLDYWTDYTLQMTVGANQDIWRKSLDNNDLKLSAKAMEYLKDYDLISKPGGAAYKIIKQLLAGGMEDSAREKAYQELLKMRGSTRNGREIFNRLCVVCHKVGDQGVEYGPDLTDVGSRLKPLELVESIMDPNAKLDPKYATTNVETKDGEAFTGFIMKETPEILTLRVASGKDLDFQKSNLSKQETIKQSSMPEGLAGGMSGAEFLDMVEYLKSLTKK